MSGNSPPPIMTSPVFRYAVLVVLSVVVIMGAGVCYRTRAYRRNGSPVGGEPVPTARSVVAPRDWGPKPVLFDAHLRPPSEKSESDWDQMMPISVARGPVGASGTSSVAQVSMMISMPFAEPFDPPEVLSDDEHYPPNVEIGISEMQALLNANALRYNGQATSQKTDSGSMDG
ncbi:hypothetical protein C8R47DRAFT_1073805 [Mycena vitilis]|nr:hypothetical protein C8R47DRAFT_1073805 [Mycena vitilis]